VQAVASYEHIVFLIDAGKDMLVKAGMEGIEVRSSLVSINFAFCQPLLLAKSGCSLSQQGYQTLQTHPHRLPAEHLEIVDPSRCHTTRES